ncbi:hypothetical protein ES705_46182 [subsurface metagenome]
MCVKVDEAICIPPHAEGSEDFPGTHELKREAGKRLLGPAKAILPAIIFNESKSEAAIETFLEGV